MLRWACRRRLVHGRPCGRGRAALRRLYRNRSGKFACSGACKSHRPGSGRVLLRVEQSPLATCLCICICGCNCGCGWGMCSPAAVTSTADVLVVQAAA
eukprot:366083-Chlamydomonas_euryale.AAC.6